MTQTPDLKKKQLQPTKGCWVESNPATVERTQRLYMGHPLYQLSHQGATFSLEELFEKEAEQNNSCRDAVWDLSS